MDAPSGLAALLGRAASRCTAQPPCRRPRCPAVNPLGATRAPAQSVPCRADAAPRTAPGPGAGQVRRCRRPCPLPLAISSAGSGRGRGRRRPTSPLGHRLEAEAGAGGADRLPLPDQPRHRLAALRRPAADRGRRAGQRLGGRGRAHAGQGPLGSHAQHRLRLHPPRRRRPGLQQGHHDRARA